MDLLTTIIKLICFPIKFFFHPIYFHLVIRVCMTLTHPVYDTLYAVDVCHRSYTRMCYFFQVGFLND